MIKTFLTLLSREILAYKWYVVIFAAASVLFCGTIYLATRRFDWTYGKIRAFAVFYDLNKNGRAAFALIFGRLLFVLCMVVFGGSRGLWDLLVLELFTAAAAAAAKNAKELLQTISFAAVFAVSLLENLFLSFYREIEKNRVILVVAVAFGLFGFLYSLYQSLISYNNLLKKAAEEGKKEFDIAFYEQKNKR